MATAGCVQHPYILSGIISDAYILFGVGCSFDYMNWNNSKNWNNSNKQERANIEWTTFDSGERRYTSVKNNKPLTIKVDPDNLVDIVVKLTDVPIDEVTLLVKRNQTDLSHLNQFLRSEVNHQCYFGLPEGWSGYF